MRSLAWLLIAGCGGSAHAPGDAGRNGSADAAVPIDAPVDVAPDAPRGTFASAVDIAVGTAPVSVAITDLDGDGKLDLVVANSGSATLSVLRNTTATGATTPTFAKQPDLTTGTSPNTVVAADFDGDGRPDLATTGYDTTAGDFASVFLAVSSFARSDFTLNANSPALAVGDLNGDGKPDLAVAYFCSSTMMCLSILLDTTASGATTPSFATRADFVTHNRADAIAVGDIDGDGVPDVLLPYYSGGVIGVFVNTTAAGATTPTLATESEIAANTTLHGLVIRDLDGDGRPDLAVSRQGGSLALLNTTTVAGTPTFAAPVDVPAGTTPTAIASADFDGDGKPDLAIVNYGSGTVSVLLDRTVQGGTPTFTPHVDYGVGSMPIEIAVGDLNGDGRPDLVVANRASNTVSVLLAR